jgi:Putative transposase of IS4/5 family (DUF4096)
MALLEVRAAASFSMWEVAWSAATNSPIRPGRRLPRCCPNRPPWWDLPERCGPWQTCDERFRRWQADGTRQRLLAHAQTKSDAVGNIDWEVVIDATIVRAHQHAAGPRNGDHPTL